jgi:hypothetical protein
MKIPSYLLIFGITTLFSCNAKTEDGKTKPQNKDTLEKVSVDTFHLDTNEVSSDYKTYPNGTRPLTDPNELLNQIKNNKIKVLFHGIVTEPFLDIYLTENELLYIDNGSQIQETYLLLSKFDKSLKSQVIHYEDKNGNQKKLEIKKEPAGDGMSDREFPYLLLIGDWRGGGDSKHMTDWSEYQK